MNSRIRKLGLLGILFLILSCSSTHKTMTNTSSTPPDNTPPLIGTEWLLTELVGTPVVPESKASLSFFEAGRAAGNASCNRFTGGVDISGATIKFGQLASTRMACVDSAVSAQEDLYLKALGAAMRFERKDDSLLIYADGFDKPLRFLRVVSK
jgi:heat shock protein HslJ